MPTDLLLITPGFPANEEDSTCIPPLQGYLRALRKSRPELCISVIATQYPYTSAPYRWNGIEVFPSDGRITSWRRPLAWLRASRAFDGIRKRGAIGAIHSLWLGECAMLAARFSKRCGSRHVLTLMGQDARDGMGWWRRIDPPSATVCLSERHATAFAGMTGGRPDAVVPWGIEGTSKVTSADQRDIDLLFVGSMIEVKRPRSFIEVAERVAKERPIRAVMIGAKGQRQAATTYIGGGNGTIEFHNELPRAEVLAWMARSRILLHPSAFESQGYVFDEALLNGMSIVSGEVGSAAASERWRLANDAGDMVKAVIDLLEHPVSKEALIQRDVNETVKTYLHLYGLL